MEIVNQEDSRKLFPKVKRNGKGQFTQGTQGGPGRPRLETEREYLRVLISACPISTWKEIVEKAVADALDGNHKAREWLAGYLIGNAGKAEVSLTDIVVESEAGVDAIHEMVEDKKNPFRFKV